MHVRLFFLYLDTNECANNPCNQWCKNTNGGYICHCHKGYELQGKNTCVGRLNRDICLYVSFYIPCQTSLRHFLHNLVCIERKLLGSLQLLMLSIFQECISYSIIYVYKLKFRLSIEYIDGKLRHLALSMFFFKT